jgi:hypothetical protein
LHRRFSLAVAIASAAFLVGAVALLWMALRPSSHPDPDLLEFENQVSGVLAATPPRSYLAVLHINQLDPTKRQAVVKLRLFLPTHDAPSIVDLSDGKKLFSPVPGLDWGRLGPNQPAYVITKHGWSDAPLDIRVTSLSQNSDGTALSQIWDGQVPLWLLGYPPMAIIGTGSDQNDPALFADATKSPQKELQLTLDLAGDPADYPDDQYVLTAIVSISLPPGLNDLAQGRQTFSPPLAAVASAGLPFTIQRNDFEQNGMLTVQIYRPLSTKLLVWLVALAPLLLLAAGLIARGQRPAALDFATAAALLAILPLRQVLVPPDVGGFTRVDALLAAELVTFIAVAALAHLYAADKTTAAVITRITAAAAESLDRIASATAESLNWLVNPEVRQAYRSRTRLNQRRRRSRPQPPLGDEERPDPG